MGAEKPGAPKIVFILADDLGYGDVGCYGQRAIQTSAIDRMAAEGMRFTDFYAGSTVCAPSRCTLMTGLHTGHARIRGNALVPLAPEDLSVAELLQRAGYATGLVGKWGLGEEGSTGIPNRTRTPASKRPRPQAWPSSTSEGWGVRQSKEGSLRLPRGP